MNEYDSLEKDHWSSSNNSSNSSSTAKNPQNDHKNATTTTTTTRTTTNTSGWQPPRSSRLSPTVHQAKEASHSQNSSFLKQEPQEPQQQPHLNKVKENQNGPTTTRPFPKHPKLQPQQPQPRRYFGTHPVTAQESKHLFLDLEQEQPPQKEHRDTRRSRLDVPRNRTTTPTTNATTAQPQEGDGGKRKRLRMAVCHPTIHGNLSSLEQFLIFVSYYRLLGFDHVFLWYLPHIAHVPGFDPLASLPYVTLTEYHHSDYDYYHGQYVAMQECLNNTQFARLYDWALMVDADEFLWLNNTSNRNNNNSSSNSSSNNQTSRNIIKTWMVDNGYHPLYHYLSFGKYMYTTKHIWIEHNHEQDDVDVENNDVMNDKNGTTRTTNTILAAKAGFSTTIVDLVKLSSSSASSSSSLPLASFGLEFHPYTGGAYCYNGQWTSPTSNLYCPGWQGRCKTMVRPQYWHQATMERLLHGEASFLRMAPQSQSSSSSSSDCCAKHLHPHHEGHLKEWVFWVQNPANHLSPRVVHHGGGGGDGGTTTTTASTTTSSFATTTTTTSGRSSLWVTEDNQVETYFTMSSHFRQPLPPALGISFFNNKNKNNNSNHHHQDGFTNNGAAAGGDDNTRAAAAAAATNETTASAKNGTKSETSRNSSQALSQTLHTSTTRTPRQQQKQQDQQDQKQLQQPTRPAENAQEEIIIRRNALEFVWDETLVPWLRLVVQPLQDIKFSPTTVESSPSSLSSTPAT
ncbi:hypothetical protein ACA910_009957 [Epithemia clementina (nom. ined.)]